MNVSGIQPTQTSASPILGKSGGLPDLPPPPPQEDTVEISPEATQQILANVPVAVSAAVADLQGDPADMAADFRTIGDYFASNGGRSALDSFMKSNFTDEQLRAFPPPVDGFINTPGRPSQAVPGALASAVADLKGSKTNMGDDLKAIGDYFKERGGPEVRHAFMKANFSEDQRETFRLFRFRTSSDSSTSSVDSSTPSA